MGGAAMAPPRGTTAPVAHVAPSPCPAAASLRGGQGPWTADQLASTYGLSTLYGGGRSGAGQSVGVFELEPYLPSDIQTYQSCFGLDVPVTDVTVDGGAGPPADDGEAALDVEAVAGLAPSSSVDRLHRARRPTRDPSTPTRPWSTTMRQRCSRRAGDSARQMIPPEDRMAESMLFAQAATQGQTVLAASGDSGSSDCYNLKYGRPRDGWRWTTRQTSPT